MFRTSRVVAAFVVIAGLALLYTPSNTSASETPTVIVIPEVLYGPDPVLLIVDFPPPDNMTAPHNLTLSINRGGLEMRTWNATVREHYETSLTFETSWGRGWYNILVREGNRTWLSASIRWDYSMAEVMDRIGGNVDAHLVALGGIVLTIEETKALIVALILLLVALVFLQLQHIIARKRGEKSILDKGLRKVANVRIVHFWGARGGVFTDNDRGDKEFIEKRNLVFRYMRGLPPDWDESRLVEFVKAARSLVINMRSQNLRWRGRHRKGARA